MRYATSVPSPTTTRTYGPRYTDAVKHFTTSWSTSTWGSWVPGQTVISATDTKDPYGQAAWSSMWLQADLHNYVCRVLWDSSQIAVVAYLSRPPLGYSRQLSVPHPCPAVSWSCHRATILVLPTAIISPRTLCLGLQGVRRRLKVQLGWMVDHLRCWRNWYPTASQRTMSPTKIISCISKIYSD